MDVASVMELLKSPHARLRLLREPQTFVNNTALNVYMQPPQHHIWWLICGTYNNGDNVARNASIQLVRAIDNEILAHLHWTTGQVAGNEQTFPTNVSNALQLAPSCYPIPIPRDKRIRFYWAAGGASAGGAGYSQVYVVEVDIREHPITSEVNL